MFESLVHSSAHSPVPAHSHAGYSEGTRAGTIIIVFCNLLDIIYTHARLYIYMYIHNIYIYTHENTVYVYIVYTYVDI